MLTSFQQHIVQKKLFRPQAKLLLAFSGGVDSVVLAHLLRQAHYDFALAHCNFQLRDAESDADESFSRDFAKQLGIPFFSQRFETNAYASVQKLGTQEAARNLRYAWFEELMQSHSFHHLLTAHHADDNLETVLMNFFKGTGIAGLKGIPESNKHIVRPLLPFTKGELIIYAKENNLSWREDGSNQNDKYLRNFMRLQIIPEIEHRIPSLKKNIHQNIIRFSDTDEILQQEIERITKKLVQRNGELIRIPVLLLAKQPGQLTLGHHIFSDYGFTANQIAEILRLMQSESGRYVQSPTHRVLRNRAWLELSPLSSSKLDATYIVEQDQREVELPIGKLVVTANSDSAIIKDENIAQLDASKIEFPLLIRKWKQGDYFYPLGMRKKKKLSRFFIDQKLSITQKEKIFVVESNKRIVWIIGHRIDDRFKITDPLKYSLKLTLFPSDQISLGLSGR